MQNSLIVAGVFIVQGYNSSQPLLHRPYHELDSLQNPTVAHMHPQQGALANHPTGGFLHSGTPQTVHSLKSLPTVDALIIASREQRKPCKFPWFVFGLLTSLLHQGDLRLIPSLPGETRLRREEPRAQASLRLRLRGQHDMVLPPRGGGGELYPQ